MGNFREKLYKYKMDNKIYNLPNYQENINHIYQFEKNL